MATYNTAFGALPSTKTLTGRTNTVGRAPEEERQPRNWTQQYVAQRQGQGAKRPEFQQDQTFADLQRQGRARPAPQPFAPQMVPQMAQPSLAAQVQGVVGGAAPAMAAPAPAPAPAAAPMPASAPTAAQAPAPAAAPAPAPAPAAYTPVAAPLAQQVSQVVGAPPAASVTAETGAVGTASNPYTDANLPPATAPDGSVYRDANGRTWTRRMGMWSAEATAGQPTLTGYASLRPTWMGSAGGIGTMDITGVDQFMRDYGRPETPEQEAQLAANGGISVEQLRQYMSNRLFPTAAEIALDREEGNYLRQTGMIDPATGYLRANKPSWVVYVPASQGGPGYRAKTVEEAQADYDRAGGLGWSGRPTAQSWQMYLDAQGDWGGAKAGTMATGAGAGAGPGGPAFGGPQLVEQPEGVTAVTTPRPVLLPGGTTGGAAGGTAGTGRGVGGTRGVGGGTGGPIIGQGPGQTIGTPNASDQLRMRLLELFDRLGGGATSEEQKAFEAQRAAREADLQAKFLGEKTALDEEMARRGLYASSIGTGRFGDLAGQQARALAGMNADLLAKQAELAADRQKSLLTGLTSMFGTQADIEYRSQQLQQDAALKGRAMDIEEARDLATKEQNLKDLALRERLGNQTYGLGRDQLIVDIIRAVGAANIDPKTLAEIMKQYGLTMTDVTGTGTGTGGGTGGETGGGNPSVPSSWPPGSRDGVERSTPDGTVYVWRATAGQWLPKSITGGGGGGGGTGGGTGGGAGGGAGGGTGTQF